MKDLSIIIPVYNVEKYIKKCVYSILSQDANTDRYETIFINDGSTDNSENIIKDILKHNPRNHLKILQKKNGGLRSCFDFIR